MALRYIRIDNVNPKKVILTFSNDAELVKQYGVKDTAWSVFTAPPNNLKEPVYNSTTDKWVEGYAEQPYAVFWDNTDKKLEFADGTEINEVGAVKFGTGTPPPLQKTDNTVIAHNGNSLLSNVGNKVFDGQSNELFTVGRETYTQDLLFGDADGSTMVKSGELSLSKPVTDYTQLVIEVVNADNGNGNERMSHDIFNNKARPVDSVKDKPSSWGFYNSDNVFVKGQFTADNEFTISDNGNGGAISRIYGISSQGKGEQGIQGKTGATGSAGKDATAAYPLNVLSADGGKIYNADKSEFLVGGGTTYDELYSSTTNVNSQVNLPSGKKWDDYKLILLVAGYAYTSGSGVSRQTMITYSSTLAPMTSPRLPNSGFGVSNSGIDIFLRDDKMINVTLEGNDQIRIALSGYSSSGSNNTRWYLAKVYGIK